MNNQFIPSPNQLALPDSRRLQVVWSEPPYRPGTRQRLALA